MTNKGLAREYAQKRLRGMEFSEIRRQLEEQDVDEAEIREIIAAINEWELSSLHNRQQRGLRMSYRFIGYTLIAIGLGITLWTYFSSQFNYQYVIAIGPVGSGLLILFIGKRNDNKVAEIGKYTRFRT